MDPDATLQSLRSMFRVTETLGDQYLTIESLLETIEGLREQFRDLDEHLTTGGHLPAEWRNARPFPTLYSFPH